MKARIPAKQILTKQMQNSIKEIVSKEREKQSKELIAQILKVSLINLNRNFGFGQQRLIKFLDTVTEMFREHMHDELYWYHVETKSIVTLFCVIVSIIFLVTTIILAVNLPFITVLQQWWAFLTGAVISGTVLVFCVISVIADIAERKRRK